MVSGEHVRSTAENMSAKSEPEEKRREEIRGEIEAGTPARNPRTLNEEKAYEYAAKHGYSRSEAEGIIEDFRSYWQSKGWKDKGKPLEDVDARFQYWVRRQPEFGHPPSGNGSNGTAKPAKKYTFVMPDGTEIVA